MYPSIFRQNFAVTLREMPQYIQDQVDERRANRAAAALSAASAAAADEKEDAQSGAAASLHTAKRKKKPAAQPQATWQQKQNRSGQGRRSAAGVVGSRDHRAAVAATQTMTQMCGSPRIRSSTSRSTIRRRRHSASASASASASTSTSASATAAAARSRGVHARAPSHNENVEQFVEYVLCDRDTADVFLRRFKFNINDAVHAYLTQTDEVRFSSSFSLGFMTEFLAYF